MTAARGRTGRPPLTEERKTEIRLEIARAAVDLLMDRLSDAPRHREGQEVVIAHQLVVRESTGQGR